MNITELLNLAAGLLTGGGLSALLAWRTNRRKGVAEAASAETEADLRRSEAYEHQIIALLENNTRLVERLSAQNSTINKDKDALHAERARTREISDRCHEAEMECKRLNALIKEAEEDKNAMYERIVRYIDTIKDLTLERDHYAHWHCQETREGEVTCKRIPEQVPRESVYTPCSHHCNAAPLIETNVNSNP